MFYAPKNPLRSPGLKAFREVSHESATHVSGEESGDEAVSGE
jgi:hypothetical protein